jgi:hypothetical protein
MPETAAVVIVLFPNCRKLSYTDDSASPACLRKRRHDNETIGSPAPARGDIFPPGRRRAPRERTAIMKSVELPLPLVGAVAATRGMLGMGAGLLVAPSVPEARRKAVGWVLLAIGALSTIPLAVSVFSRRREHA